MPWTQFLDSGIAVGVLLLFLFGFYKGWWSTKGEVDRLAEQLDRCHDQEAEWRAIAMKSSRMADTASHVAEKAVEAAAPDKAKIEELANLIDNARSRGLIP